MQNMVNMCHTVYTLYYITNALEVGNMLSHHTSFLIGYSFIYYFKTTEDQILVSVDMNMYAPVFDISINYMSCFFALFY